MSSGNYLQLHHVHKRFGSFTALDSIDLSVSRGEFVCFLGPSGCGKTTLLRVIAGLEMQTSGRILQDGRDILLLPPAERDYGIMFQSYALFPNLTVSENVAYGLVNRRESRARVALRVAELLELVGLPASAGSDPDLGCVSSPVTRRRYGKWCFRSDRSQDRGIASSLSGIVSSSIMELWKRMKSYVLLPRSANRSV